MLGRCGTRKDTTNKSILIICKKYFNITYDWQVSFLLILLFFEHNRVREDSDVACVIKGNGTINMSYLNIYLQGL